ncbi:C2 domain-containing protein [Artemisia annua]|uniref:C2 domain-containing protein n=1 Tax=Artemisia annua TaxID=35608 RepID=A0A2U1M4E0_ARTAN|nr:C2 domain-containing protein [Artemisia annua]
MDKLQGALRIKIKKGVGLAVRDVKTSDPYIVVKMARWRLKTHVIENNVNPEWNEYLDLTIQDPDLPVQLTVYDQDKFSKDDNMGDSEIDIKPFLEALKANKKKLPSGTVLKKLQPSRSNLLADESRITWKRGKIIQDMCLRLKNVECGEVELELSWVENPGATSS